MDRVCNPPPGRIVLYKECLKARVRLSLFYFYVKLLRFFWISPCSIMPNSWSFICGFMVKCLSTGFELILTLFRTIFNLVKSSQSRGWYYVFPWNKQQNNALLRDIPSVHRQKERFFFVKHPTSDWEIDSWRIPQCSTILPHILSEEKVQYEAPLHYGVSEVKVLLSDETLACLGLCQVQPRGARKALSLCLSLLGSVSKFLTIVFLLSKMDLAEIKKLKQIARSKPREPIPNKPKRVRIVSRQGSVGEAPSGIEASQAEGSVLPAASQVPVVVGGVGTSFASIPTFGETNPSTISHPSINNWTTALGAFKNRVFG